jgi:hypothetical protein
MGILFYQIGIFVAIQIAAFFGKSSRNVAIILISLFTLLQVYTSGLMILQFITIFVSYIVSKNIIGNDDNVSTPKNSNTKFGREMGQLPKTNNGVSTQTYGLSSSNPILMSSIPSAYRFLDSITANNSELSYQRRGSTKDDNFSQPLDMYEFSKNGRVVTMIYIYPYYNSNVEIIPNILK